MPAKDVKAYVKPRSRTLPCQSGTAALKELRKQLRRSQVMAQ
jgi:hypothetical protein